jgi:hypothetical protein
MARRASIETDEFSVTARWPAIQQSASEPTLDATMSRLKICAGSVCATRYQTDKGDIGDEIEVPAYNLAEWAAESWWSLLFEPQKSDDAMSDYSFRSRHWLGMARHGFALPDLWIIPEGEQIELLGTERYIEPARLTFTHAIDFKVATATVRTKLAEFIEDVVRRLNEAGVRETALHGLWANIRNTDAEAEQFCQLMGALGLSPYYDLHPEIEAALDRLSDLMSPRALRDLCEASTVDGFQRSATISEIIWKQLPKAQTVDFSAISNIEIPADNHQAAWRMGYEAVSRIRETFGISSSDPKGGEAFLDRLGVDVDTSVPSVQTNSEISDVSGALERDESHLQVVLADERLPQRRFTAARAGYLGWTGAKHSSRLVTSARTRDQQASRAFAAEILAPIGYIKRRASNKVVSMSRIGEISAELGVSSWVVRYQAQNGHLQIA